LRSPLNPILGWTRLLQTGKLDAIRQQEALATIERNAKLQTQLIEDLLDISRIMQGKLTLTAASVDLAFVISAALDTVRLAAEAKQIHLTVEYYPRAEPPQSLHIMGDSARLQQVVWNLLSNAIKFTPAQGQVCLELRQLDAFAEIRVVDTGKGIHPHFLPHVFEYFRQEDGSTTRRFGGLGLGLAIVRQIVELHGGIVWAESHGEGQGATFVVQLPLPQPNQAKPARQDSTATPSSALNAANSTFALNLPLADLKILVVDDDIDTRQFQSFLLQKQGAVVIAVASGLEALKMLNHLIPDVIVSDIGMPDLDGYQLIQQIRSRPAHHGGTIPAIALTAYARDFDQQRAQEAGFHIHLTKPIDAELLVEAICNLVAAARE
jgi:CheY-like chemotaxis protein